MPKVATRQKVLDGKAEVLTYARDLSAYYYREPDGKGGYRQKKLNGCGCLADAAEQAIDVYVSLRQEIKDVEAGVAVPKRRRKSDRLSCVQSVEDFNRSEAERVEAGIIGADTAVKKVYVLRHALEYLKLKEIEFVDQIDENTFNDYLLFRKEATKINQRNETKIITNWLNYLIKLRKLNPDVAALKLTPSVRVRGEDLTANPAIGPEDWFAIWQNVKNRRIKNAGFSCNHRHLYWWKCFYAFIMTGKNSGLRPIELHNLKWSDVDIIDMGQLSKNDERRHLIAEIRVRKAKTGEPRQVPANCGSQLAEWFYFQQDYAEKHRWSFSKDSYVFGNFYNEGRPYDHSLFVRYWRQVNADVELKGHWASDKPYTLYSLRSSFVEDRLLEDKPIAQIAMMSGHSPDVLMRHYQQLDIRRKSRELTELPIGVKKDPRKSIDLFAEEEEEQV